MWSHFPHLEEEHSQANYIMGLIANTQLKIPSGLKVVPRGYPISGHTIVGSSAQDWCASHAISTCGRGRG